MDEFSIQISSNLINRLTDNGEKMKKKTKKTRPRILQEPQRPQTKGDQKQITDESGRHKGNANSGWPIQPPLFLPPTPPVQPAYTELDAVQTVLKESERILEKLQKQEENMVQEVTERAKDLRDKEFNLPSPKPMPCLAENNAWIACYKENPNDPLKCAHLTKNFADCARRVRQLVNSADK